MLLVVLLVSLLLLVVVVVVVTIAPGRHDGATLYHSVIYCHSISIVYYVVI